MRTIDEVIADMPGACVFTVLDGKSGFLQIKLDEPSSYLTTLNTPIGRYRWLRPPFGIKCAPEIFQRIMDEMLEGIDGAYVIMDVILVAGVDVVDVAHRNIILKKVIEKATSYNLKLNIQKCKVRQPVVPYVGHLLTPEGLKPDPAKVAAVREMPTPQSKEELKRFLGFITYMSKFIPNLSEINAPLRELLMTDVVFDWQSAQVPTFSKLVELCCSSPVLVYFDINKPVELHCDASLNGLGAVVIQGGRPVAYSSRSAHRH